MRKLLFMFLSLWSVALFAQPALQGTDKLIIEGTNTAFKGTLSSVKTFVDAPDLISPAQITANQNDYSPTGWSTATLVRLDFGTSIPVITGFAAFTGTKTVVNESDNWGVIAAEHPSSTVSNRVAGTGDWLLPPGGAITLTYDATGARSRVVSTTFQPQNLGSFNKGMYLNAVTTSATAADNEYLAFTTVGSGAAVTAQSEAVGLPRGMSMATGTTSTGACAISALKDGEFFKWGDNFVIGFATVYIPTLSTSGQRFTADFALSLINGSSAALPNRSSAGIKYNDNVNSGKWLLYNVDHTTAEGSTDSGVTVASNTLYVLMVVVDKALSETRYFINGAYVGRVATNMPGSGVSANVRCDIVKSIGTTSTKFVCTNIGYMIINN